MLKKRSLTYNFIISVILVFNSSISYAEDKHCSLKVGYEINPPLIYKDKASNRLAGLDVELLEKIATTANCSIEWVKMPWRNILYSIKSGKLLLATSATETAERSEYSNFTIPYRVETVKLYVRKEEKHEIRADSLREFLEQTTLNIGYNDNYEYSKETYELMHDPKFKNRFESVIDSTLNFYKLQGNLIDGILMESLMANNIIKLHDWENEIESYDFVVGNNDLSLIVSKKADPDGWYLKTLNDAITKLKNK